MEKLLIVNLFNKEVVVNVKISNRNASRVIVYGGHIYLTLKDNFSISDVEKKLMRVFTKSRIDKLYSSLYITDYYVDILGIRRRLVNLSKGQNRISKEDFVVENQKQIDSKLKNLLYDIIQSRVEKYSQIMNIPISYQVKITSMRSCIGKNYFTKNLLTFDHDLIHYSLEIIDSVVVHELTHYFVHNHSIDFYDILLKYVPNYKQLSQKLINGVRQ
ncbi:MAG: M48 family metallopeptidase [Bacilli bacterium]|nr:M48 family metallopeptidase [Bacillales bacterium]MDY2574823.1 M48 family metallopeptidase [Bacilli bacterium]